MVSAIIVAAGSSRRMGSDKLFATLAGKPVLWHSLRSFSECKEVDEILVVTREDRMDEIERLVAAERLKKVRKVITGGEERHISVWNGLQAIDAQGSKFIAIHDGARPLTTPKLIRACIRLAEQHGAACCASQIPDTVKRASIEQMVTESIERTGLWAMQTPQIFSSGLILQAYAALMAKHEMVTDEVSAVQKLGKKIALLKNDEWNFKITFPHDLELAEHVLETRAKKKKIHPCSWARRVEAGGSIESASKRASKKSWRAGSTGFQPVRKAGVSPAAPRERQAGCPPSAQP